MGVDLWPYISGEAAASPRSEMLISAENVSIAKQPKALNGALISGDYKIIIGTQSYGFWTAPNYPNRSTDHSTEQPVDCGISGCLFNIKADPSEYTDLSQTMPDKL